jgi:nitrogen regulatory protein P-II 1
MTRGISRGRALSLERDVAPSDTYTGGTMKLVKCIVRAHKADTTADALKKLDVSGITVTQVGGRGRTANPITVFRGTSQEMRYMPQMMIDVVVADYLVEDVVRTVMETAGTGAHGDGRIFVMPVEEAYTVRTRAGGPD